MSSPSLSPSIIAKSSLLPETARSSCGTLWTVKIWNLTNYKIRASLTGHSGYVNTVAVSPDGLLCASGGKDGVILLWDLAEEKKLYLLDSGSIINALCFSPNRYWLCAATEASIKIWDLESKTIVVDLKVDAKQEAEMNEGGAAVSSGVNPNYGLIILPISVLSSWSIPLMVDGLKPGQRKILFCSFKRNFVKEAKVAQFSGYVSEHSAYHHGEQSLASTIIGMAQDYVGSNNLNLLQPNGQFGTRRQGGKDHASARVLPYRKPETGFVTVTSLNIWAFQLSIPFLTQHSYLFSGVRDAVVELLHTLVAVHAECFESVISATGCSDAFWTSRTTTKKDRTGRLTGHGKRRGQKGMEEINIYEVLKKEPHLRGPSRRTWCRYNWEDEVQSSCGASGPCPTYSSSDKTTLSVGAVCGKLFRLAVVLIVTGNSFLFTHLQCRNEWLPHDSWLPNGGGDVFPAYTSLAGTMILDRSMADDLIPSPVQSYLNLALRCLFTPLSVHPTIVIEGPPTWPTKSQLTVHMNSPSTITLDQVMARQCVQARSCNNQALQGTTRRAPTEPPNPNNPLVGRQLDQKASARLSMKTSARQSTTESLSQTEHEDLGQTELPKASARLSII
ncbi:hypothetical protein TEA_024696 [Camellia sinensis var. sinensis]|uniref:DNA topoisomerase (ATP-hydrolyzing) n=1 Tax=Camellia sinensis var. sinensis TaxID=542762 RepID=A0A4S4D6U7_CAMSN|nr:hypothetical protein TEA_024696 [Camellia sinensis var. sinensis]